MDKISVLSILLVSFPEAIIIALLGILSIGKFEYLKLKSNLIRIVLFAILTSVFSFFIRRNISNIIESMFVNYFLYTLLFIFVIRLKFYESILSSLFACVIIFISESIIGLIIINLTSIDIESVYANDYKRILLSLPIRFFQIVLIYLSLRWKFKFISLESATIRKKEYFIQLIVYIISIGTLIFLSSAMIKTLLFDKGDIINSQNSMFLRLNVYIALFVTIILTLAIKNINEFYKHKSMMSNTELIQSLKYISNLVDENNYKEVKNAVENLKSHIQQL